MSLRHLDICGNALEQLDGVEQLVWLTWLDASNNALKVCAYSLACAAAGPIGALLDRHTQLTLSCCCSLCRNWHPAVSCVC